jgi:DNA (cytosine-5)-methyltransferase 1
MEAKLTYIDLFAGCGGLSLGLHNSGWKGLFAIEKSPDAFKTLKYNLIDKLNHFNWPEWLEQQNHDIYELLEEHRDDLEKLKNEVDMVVGGPPCQGFSSAGKRLLQDERNKLVHAYLEIIEIVKPKVIMIENVKGFDVGFKIDNKERTKATSDVVIERLIELGYSDATKFLFDFSEYGVPQKRKRVIIIATLNNSAQNFKQLIDCQKENFLETNGLNETTSLQDAISDLLCSNGTLTNKEFPLFKFGKYSVPKTNYQKLMRTDNQKKGKIVDSHRFVNHKENTVEKFKDIIDNNLTNKEVRTKYQTKKTSTKLLEAGKPSTTLTTLPDDYVHYCEPRILTVREYARIQSFPDWYEIKGKYTTGGKMRVKEVPRYTQVGNAIPPLFAEQCGLILKEIVNGS